MTGRSSKTRHLYLRTSVPLEIHGRGGCKDGTEAWRREAQSHRRGVDDTSQDPFLGPGPESIKLLSLEKW